MRVYKLFCDDCKKEILDGKTVYTVSITDTVFYNRPRNTLIPILSDGITYKLPIVEKELCLECLDKYKRTI